MRAAGLIFCAKGGNFLVGPCMSLIEESAYSDCKYLLYCREC